MTRHSRIGFHWRLGMGVDARSMQGTTVRQPNLNLLFDDFPENFLCRSRIV